jgi:hypothetical protein
MRRIILFFLALPAFSQALVDHAAAAAGASIGATAGKPLSNGITAIFGKVDDTTAQAAKKPAEKDKDKAEKSKPEKPSALGSAPSASASGPSTPSSRPQRASSSRPSRRVVQSSSWPEPVVYTQVPAPVAKEPALQDLLNVQIGTKEQDCIAGLGTPSSRISIPEEGHMIELLRYTAQGRLLGTIRVDNGQVVNVLAANIAR